MATPYLDDDGRRAISAAVTAAEANTSGEIVTILADRSDGYMDVAFAWSIGVAFTALAVVAALPHFYLGLIDDLLGRWGYHWTARELLTLALGIGVLKFIGMMLLQLWQPLKFWLIPGRIKAHRVRDRAVGYFKVGAEARTQGRTGILLYLSMRERRADIVADAAIAQIVPPEAWGHAMHVLLADVRHGRTAEGMAAAVTEIGKLLSEHFPHAADDVNELPDRLIEV